ncbi:MAG TPA: serine hydrolase domain-containing protein [Candidatus Elarobacter sp.]|jgi:CubicO group peptidase (beta-lactamase class C family)
MLRRRFILSSAAVLGLAAAACPALAAQPAQVSAAQRAAVDDALAKAMAASHTRGASVTVARAGEIVYANGAGQRDVQAKLPVDADTIFPIGSITKQFTAAAIMLLVRDGRVSLDAHAADYVPAAPHGAEYTVRELLQQTTGLANYTSVPGSAANVITSATVTPQALLALVKDAPLAFKPGTRFEYSNTNYVVLGMIVETASGMPYGRFIHERIAQPLGLAHLTFGAPASGANVARGYEAETGETAVTPWTAQATYAAGGLYAAPSDLVRWDEAFFGGKLLDASTVALMTTPPQLPGNAQSGYAMGWVHETLDGHPLIWHNGGVLGANTRNAYFPDQRIAVVVFGNSLTFDETRVVREAFRALVPPSPAQLAAERQRDSAAAPGEDPAITAAARAEYERWREGKVDLSRYDATMRAALSAATINQVSAGLAAAGPPTAFVFTGKIALPNSTGTVYNYRVVTPNGAVVYAYGVGPDGKIGGIWFKPAP